MHYFVQDSGATLWLHTRISKRILVVCYFAVSVPVDISQRYGGTFFDSLQQPLLIFD